MSPTGKSFRFVSIVRARAAWLPIGIRSQKRLPTYPLFLICIGMLSLGFSEALPLTIDMAEKFGEPGATSLCMKGRPYNPFWLEALHLDAMRELPMLDVRCEKLPCTALLKAC